MEGTWFVPGSKTPEFTVHAIDEQSGTMTYYGNSGAVAFVTNFRITGPDMFLQDASEDGRGGFSYRVRIDGNKMTWVYLGLPNTGRTYTYIQGAG